MKKLLTTLALTVTLTVTSSYAEENNQEDYCKNISYGASLIMQARQLGIEAHKVMESLDNKRLYNEMVIDAYDTPRYLTKDVVKRSIENFSNKWFILCYKSKMEAEKTQG